MAAAAAAVVFFLFCSGFSHFSSFASNRLRWFAPLKNESTWALSKCSEDGGTHVTLFDEEDYTFIKKFCRTSSWLGLLKVRNTTWSDGAAVNYNRSSVALKAGEQRCEAIDRKGTWKDFPCSDKKHFMCYNGTHYKLIKEEKNWCQALQHCRKCYSNLVSIRDDEQNKDVIGNGSGSTFWIGLRHDEWAWQSNSCTVFRHWDERDDNKPIDNGHCTVYENNINKLLYSYGCDSEASTPCSKGVTRIKAMNKTLPWEEAYQHCKRSHTGLLEIDDGQDMEAVKQWLQYTEVKGPFWIGMRQSRVFGFWIWSNRMVNYSNWRDSKAPELQRSHQCGIISKTDYTWSSDNCVAAHNFLCEEDIVFMGN